MRCSIIIPVYNKATFIEYAIRSVLNQSHQDFEIIVIDDGSQDDSALCVKNIADPRIQLIQQANSGVACARNRGIDQAQGDLICFLDADDWYLPLYLETLVNMAQQYSDIQFFATYYKRIKHHNVNTQTLTWDPGDIQPTEFIDDIFYRWRFGNLFMTACVAIRREHLKQFKPYFPAGEQWGEDQDLWFRVAERSRLAYCPNALIGYRVDQADSLCGQQKLHDVMPVYLRLEHRALTGQMPNFLRHSALQLAAYARVSVVRNLLAAGKRRSALRHLLYAWRGIIRQRWWVTLWLCLTCSPSFVQWWNEWRYQKVKNQ